MLEVAKPAATRRDQSVTVGTGTCGVEGFEEGHTFAILQEANGGP